jgi:hypothetical protein
MAGAICARTVVVIAEHLARHPQYIGTAPSFAGCPEFGYALFVPFAAVGIFHGWALLKDPFRWTHVIVPLLCVASVTLVTTMLLTNYTGRLLIIRVEVAPRAQKGGVAAVAAVAAHRVVPETEAKKKTKTSDDDAKTRLRNEVR